MIETLLEPSRFVILVCVALLMGVRWGNAPWERVRPIAFLLVNATLLATWFGGRWKGVGVCFLLALTVYGLIRLSRTRFGVWILSMFVLITFLALTKYDYPSWMPHPFRGGIWLRAIKAYVGIPDLKTTLGISYLCFRLIHVLVDYRNGAIASLPFLPFLNYVFFAPASLAGPINRYETFERDLKESQPLDGAGFLAAMQRIVIGLAKKVLIAGLIYPYALGSLEPSGAHPFVLLVIACVAYYVYIYADFSGYTDIAVGLGRLFGIKLPENFDRPYLASNLQDFWNRWHMTLTGWIRTYVFYPLNLELTRRHSRGAKLLNPVICVLVSFLLIGMWHGNQWNFVVFGLLHGLGISFVLILRKIMGRPSNDPKGFALAWRRVATFSFVSFSFIAFVYPLGDIPWLIGRAFGFGD